MLDARLEVPAGTVVAVLVLAVALLVVTVLLLRERRAHRSPDVVPAGSPVEVDPVTGVPTGASFTATVQAGGPGVALLHLGLDGFRAFNQMHGRAAGDAVLAEVAQRLQVAVRGGDAVGRLGGDEFGVLLHDGAGAVDVAVRLLAVLGAPHEVGPARVSLSASIGVAQVPGNDDQPGSAPQLLQAAESAAAEAKIAGGGCVRVWDPCAAREREDVDREVRRLREAVRACPEQSPDNHLEVHYQPTVDVESGVVSGVECLVRWRRDGLLVPPDAFIDLAERHGVIADLGLTVLARAVADAPALCAAAGRDLVIAVNVSAPQLQDARLAEAVGSAVTSLRPCKLVLEMTESVLVAEDGRTQESLEALVAAGGFLTVDDFGTGYATLAYLRRRPFTAFKIDRSYVREIESDPRTRALVEGLVLLAATMGMGLVAEGVETQEQADLLQAMGAPTHQGYLHARPAPLAEAVATIERLRTSLRAGTTVG